MKVLVWLIVLQGLTVSALPRRKRADYSTPSITYQTITIPNPGTLVDLGVVQESPNGVLWVPGPVPVATPPPITSSARSHSQLSTVFQYLTESTSTITSAEGYFQPSTVFQGSTGLTPTIISAEGYSQPSTVFRSSTGLTPTIISAEGYPQLSTVFQSSTRSTFTTISAGAYSSSNGRETTTHTISTSKSISTSSVTPIVSVVTSLNSSGIAQILPTLSTQTPAAGTVITSLATSGNPNSAPLINSPIPTPTSIISPTGSATSVISSVVEGMPSDNIFQPVATDAPPPVISSRSDHPVPRLGIEPQNSPIGTNKFYANFFLGSQSAATWTHPYSVAWAKGGGASSSWGMSISHIDANQRVFGPNSAAGATQYFINPIGIQSLILSATELGSQTTLSTDTITPLSINVNLSPSPGDAPAIIFPLVQGMGFVTGIYTGTTPIIQTGVFFRSITQSPYTMKPGVTKYTILLEDGETWLLYAYSPGQPPVQFTVVSNSLVQATSNFNGIIQIAKNPGGDAEALYDHSVGAYPVTAALSGSVNGATGSYTLSFSKGGNQSSRLLMFALPHHVQSFDPTTASAVMNVQLDTTTKGTATAVFADSWTLIESLPTTMGFAPWSPSYGAQKTLSVGAVSAIQVIAASEVSQDMEAQSDLNSMYYSGKALAKFAGIVYTLNDLLGNEALAQAGLEKLKTAFGRFANNTQQYPLVHETAWGGVVSSASYTTGNSGDDFGNTYYNDHHFHYGYFIYAASVIGYLDPSWLSANDNKAYINTLVRDIANPSSLDPYFPIYRNFDWYNGHSWAHGLYESYDGKDEESSSEDSMSAYALKMWGRTIGDSNLEARSNLQLAITARSLQNYFLYTDSNIIEPSNFIGNKVSGILFENKIDHTTYFGANIEYIQGIHMLPLLPSSTLTRTKDFVQQEWDAFFSDGRAEAVQGGWKGILFANLAIVDPSTAWSFFSNSNFDAGWLDGGASRTWYLALAAGLGGAP
ncbi:hypothetical protein B7494_g2092 [Chlorociboria aeruginascens]|nr:hypothetical protein B7494_g2092 [Chlorociboria aeruginascens]